VDPDNQDIDTELDLTSYSIPIKRPPKIVVKQPELDLEQELKELNLKVGSENEKKFLDMDEEQQKE
jgi:hypothetical protein